MKINREYNYTTKFHFEIVGAIIAFIAGFVGFVTYIFGVPAEISLPLIIGLLISAE